MRIFLIIVMSAFCFAMATVYVKEVSLLGVPSAMSVFGRFAGGTVIMAAWFLVRGRLPKFHKWNLLFARGVSNVVAVYLFYECIRLTNVTKGNVYNMTYPIFVAFLGPIFLKEKTSWVRWAAVFISMIGVVLIVDPIMGEPGFGDVVGIACGVTAALTVLVLRRARGLDNVEAIVFVQMATGTVLIAPLIQWDAIPEAAWVPLILASLLGVLGQLLFTYTYKYLTAVDGSVASTIRIFIAAALGTALHGDRITWSVAAGSVMVMAGIFLIGRARDGDEQKA